MEVKKTFVTCQKCGAKVPFQTIIDGKVVWELKSFELSAFIKEHQHTMFYDFETVEEKK
ncbi:MAG: hypothetical protein J6V08_04985 [Candidatus Methanomethylophilaceae archaeon]|nr:hypothetical protein [Candidatus Methanomethylophilaceae archaeon]